MSYLSLLTCLGVLATGLVVGTSAASLKLPYFDDDVFPTQYPIDAATQPTPKPGIGVNRLEMVGACADPEHGPAIFNSCLVCAWYEFMSHSRSTETLFDQDKFAECCQQSSNGHYACFDKPVYASIGLRPSDQQDFPMQSIEQS